MNNQYKCSLCDLPVLVIEGEEPIKGCNCEGTIIAEMTATAHGIGGVEQ
jgi:hypothetical protein